MPTESMPPRPLHRNVKALSVVSLLTDASSEMILPLLPLFLTSVLGASATILGAIEGLAEAVASLLKLASGWWSDRVTRRKPLVVVGYGLASVARPLIAVAAAPWHVMVVRVTDRIGKGLRSSPRDALIADATPPEDRGRAYGVHRAADHLGAVLGPLAAWFLLGSVGLGLRSVFLWAAVPAILSVFVLIAYVRDVPPGGSGADAKAAPSAGPTLASAQAAGQPHVLDATPAPMPAEFRRYLVVLFVFTLGCSADAFLLLRAADLGVAAAMIPVLWAVHNLVRSVASTPGGQLSDRVGRRPLIVAGWLVYALVYCGFAFATEAWHAWALLVAYGLYFGLAEGPEKAYVADLVPAARRGTAFGWFNFVVGIAALPASLIFGAVWDRWGASAAFGIGASLAAVAAVGLLAFTPRDGGRRAPKNDDVAIIDTQDGGRHPTT